MNLSLRKSSYKVGLKNDFTTASPFFLPPSLKAIYPDNRDIAFKAICHTLSSSIAFKSGQTAVVHGDSFALLSQIPDHSIDLIVTDPPYHSTKKDNIYGDSHFEDDSEFLSWIDGYAAQWLRVLKPNGAVYLFCSSDMAPFIYVQLSRYWNMHGIITWTKPNEPGYDGWKQKMKKTSLRRWYPHSERIIFCSPASDGNLKRAPFGLFLKDCRKHAGLSSNMLTEMIGAYGKVNNGGAVSNWETGRNIPSREQYQRICDSFVSTGRIALMPAYEDVIRAFNVDPKQPFVDVWDFINVRQYKGKHPAEKPLDMLRHIIATSSYAGDVVLDFFSGSGSTNVAAQELGRRSIGIEIEQKWIDYSINRLKRSVDLRGNSETKTVIDRPRGQDLPLFGLSDLDYV